jgi:hypothetical protein
MMEPTRRSILATGVAATAMAAAPQVFAQQAGQSGAGKFYEKGPVRIHYEEEGSGFPLLLIAGGGVILLPNIPLVKISIMSQVVNGIVLPFVLVANQVLRALGHGQKAVRGLQITAHRGCHQLRGHLVEIFRGIADAPQDHIAIAAKTHGGIGKRQQAPGLIPAFDHLGKGSTVRIFFCRGQTAPLGKNLEKGKSDGLPLDFLGRGLGGARHFVSVPASVWLSPPLV